jgi:thioredoxin 1
MKAVVNDRDFEKGGNLKAVKFWANWCGPCKQMNPSIEKLEKEFPNVEFLSVDIDDKTDIAQRFKVMSLPTLVFLREGIEVKRVNGTALLAPLRKIVKDLVGNG